MAESTSVNYASHANHPISGQLFTFSTKSSATTWQKEVEAATGYRPQVFEDNVTAPEPEPTITPDSAALTAPLN